MVRHRDDPARKCRADGGRALHYGVRKTVSKERRRAVKDAPAATDSTFNIGRVSKTTGDMVSGQTRHEPDASSSRLRSHAGRESHPYPAHRYIFISPVCRLLLHAITT
ncbi:uncharacterized protein B0H18DRAFT_1018907 [Fomitopsis serialis]|uniref:uncharacterized protein n=1 Tax=Fomitopsis serialis TaxID=139415 RepID=UPI0020076FB9|nr:uncharacterized protein B0H18DRAFT_1018907 [Neoantrodia serialis]KAH9922052.1 hypothetical protein B0H18DRAFT_1018907 [Neoantrodia serialis]